MTSHVMMIHLVYGGDLSILRPKVPIDHDDFEVELMIRQKPVLWTLSRKVAGNRGSKPNRDCDMGNGQHQDSAPVSENHHQRNLTGRQPLSLQDHEARPKE